MSRLVSYLLALMMCLGIGACVPGSGAQQQQQQGDRVDSFLQTLDDAANALDEVADAMESEPSAPEKNKTKVKEGGQYTDKDRVALYIHTYKHLPSNYITKQEAMDLGWVSSKGNLRKVAPGKSIGGDKFGNYEGQLPKAKGRKYYECDIDYTGGKRNAKRIIFSNDGLVFYTEDHYQTFQQLY